jgi:alpha-D-ribose 1-methylphosphonate 5-triphosphate synthase subunit PhnG
LSVLSQAPAQDVAPLAEDLLPLLGDVVVTQNRTGIVMLPFTDTAKGVTFHLGEVLMAEARIRALLPDGRAQEGYGACLGRDTQHALALAVIDAAWRAGVNRSRIDALVESQRAVLKQHDEELMRKVETTRIEMETF